MFVVFLLNFLKNGVFSSIYLRLVERASVLCCSFFISVGVFHVLYIILPNTKKDNQYYSQNCLVDSISYIYIYAGFLLLAFLFVRYIYFTEFRGSGCLAYFFSLCQSIKLLLN